MKPRPRTPPTTRTSATPRLDPQTLRAFVAVAREGSVSRAAVRLHLSQPAVSLQLKTLAEATGLPLFTRTPQGMVLTADGAALLPVADRALAALADFGQAAAGLHTTVRGTLRIGTEQCLGVIDATALIDRFHRRHPQVEIQFRQAGSHELIDSLRADALDVAFVAAAALWPWLAGPLPPSRRRQAVCVVQITSLIVCLGPVVPPALATALAAGSLCLLTASFAVDVRSLARARHDPAASA